jgi:formimidoylglutamase
MAEAKLVKPGVVVNWLKGDPIENRANQWLEWDGSWDLDAAWLGVPFDGAGTVRSGSRHAPDAVRGAFPWYTSYTTSDRMVMDDLKVADIGDVHTIVTDMKTSYDNISATTQFLREKGIAMATLGGDNSVSYPIMRGICRGAPGKTLAIIHFDAHHDFRESHYGAMSSGVPYRLLLEEFPDQVKGEFMTQIGISDFCNNPTLHAYADKKEVEVISNVETWERGIRDVMNTALERARGADMLFVSIDVDGIDQAWAPGTASPNPFGLDGRDVAMAVRWAAQEPNCVGMDITELSPPTDHQGMTANWAAIVYMNFFCGLAKRKLG